jgi:glutamate N-acetyltransferase / amino-acid N-acetyltransferase
MNEKIKVIEGGVTAAKGFMAASTAAGIKYKNRQDMAMIYSKQPCKSAGTFTTNLVKAAPVKWDKNQVTSGADAQAVIINAGIANACTGEEGMGYCAQTAKAAAEVLGVAENGVLVASTCLFFVSVVIMALDASVPFSRLSPRRGAIVFTPAAILSIGSCIPITPVEATKTPFSATPKTSAAAFAVCAQ